VLRKDSLCDVGSCGDEEDGEDKKDDKHDSELGKLSVDGKPGWVLHTLSPMVQLSKESIHQK